MNAYTEKSFSGHYSEAVAEACRTQLNRIVEPVSAVQYVTALGKRKLLFDLLPDAMFSSICMVFSLAFFRNSEIQFFKGWNVLHLGQKYHSGKRV